MARKSVAVLECNGCHRVAVSAQVNWHTVRVDSLNMDVCDDCWEKPIVLKDLVASDQLEGAEPFR